jgi:TolB-like protein
LIDSLTKIEGLRVAARSSSFQFKGKAVDIRELGRKLGVGAVVEGSVRKSGDRLRVTAQLINVSDGYHLWSQTYERETKDVFAIQEEVSRSIANSLKVKLNAGRRRR